MAFIGALEAFSIFKILGSVQFSSRLKLSNLSVFA